MSKVLVTPRSITSGGHPAMDRLAAAGLEVVFCTPGKQPDEEELLRLLPDCVGYLAGVEKVSTAALEAAKRLKVISRNGTGVDGIDLAAAERLGIAVCRAEGANAQGVAELTFALILSLARSIPFSDAGIKAGRWERRKGLELRGKTLGLIGCGKIGRLVAGMTIGIGMDVVAFDVVVDRSYSPSDRFRFAPLAEVLAVSDAISLHCPPSPDGKPIVDAAALKGIKRGAYLVNTARASLVDAHAVAAALETGQLAGVATDVFETEPPRDNPLVDNDRVIATPHIGAFTHESVNRAVDVAVDNLLKQLAST